MAQQTGLSKLEEARQQKLLRLRKLGQDPYGGRFDGAESTAGIRERFVDDKDGQRACCAGRIVLLRNIGKLIFITLRDSTGIIQLGLSRKVLSAQWDIAKLLELGDIIGAEGQLGRTKTGEIEKTIDTVINSTIIDECYQVASEFCEKARKDLHRLPENVCRQSLSDLTEYIIIRNK